MRLPTNEHDGELALDRVLRVLVESGVEIRKEGPRFRLKKEDMLEYQYLCDPVPRWIVQDFSRKFRIEMVDFYFFGNTERHLREPDRDGGDEA